MTLKEKLMIGEVLEFYASAANYDYGYKARKLLEELKLNSIKKAPKNSSPRPKPYF